jgi:hypothetical protein
MIENGLERYFWRENMQQTCFPKADYSQDDGAKYILATRGVI